MTTLTEGIAQHIAMRGYGTYRATGAYVDGEIPITRNHVPSSPDTYIGVWVYAGPEADAGLGYDEPSIQLRTRGPEASNTAEELAQQLYDAYHGLFDFTLPNGMKVKSMIGTQSAPVPIGNDENNRAEFTVNFRLEIRNRSANRV